MMPKTTLTLCLGALLLLAVPAPVLAEVPAASASDRQQLERLNSRWLKSYETRDRAALDAVLADDFIGVYGQSVLSKAQMLAGLADRRVTSVSWDQLRINVNGDTAVVTAVSTLTTAREQGPATAHYRYADVYARRSGQWQAIASHVVRFEDQAETAAPAHAN